MAPTTADDRECRRTYAPILLLDPFRPVLVASLQLFVAFEQPEIAGGRSMLNTVRSFGVGAELDVPRVDEDLELVPSEFRWVVHKQLLARRKPGP